MRDDFDAVVADRFTLLDDVAVPDTWSRVQFKALDPTPAPFIDSDTDVVDLETPGTTNASRHRHRWVLAAAVLLVIVAAVVIIQRSSQSPRVVTTPTPPDTTIAENVSTTNANGWVAFAVGGPDADIYLVREGSPALRIAGSDGGGVNHACPAFSPDGRRLAYGQTAGTDADGFHDAGLVVAELTADGEVSATKVIALDSDQTATADGEARPPCAIWSADGRWLAFGAGTYQPHVHPQIVDAVWVADTESDDIRRLPDVARATDIEWAPDATMLYVATGGAIKVYSVATNGTRELADSTWGVDYLAASPDGHSIATQGRRPVDADANGLSATSRDLRLMDLEGTGDSQRLVDRGVISQGFEEMHGDGPVWSPDGARIAFQRMCDFTPDNQPCSEQNQVVVVTVNDNRPQDTGGVPPLLTMPQFVVPPPETTGPDGSKRLWWPFYVTWSPDGTTLVYGAWTVTNDVEVQSLLAVRLDADTPPAVLAEVDLNPYGGALKLHFQSWNREQG